ncbi:tetraspanin-6-like isoform X2 [Rhineura floridana]|uniref:tetraspanin-6-like isoform X2 n=1 Tax=Rhineura floridana TaxID=261503 RepID=UPI002AC81390|nr:tetraspanin-6-like isoform X2 [Rhineura floridana]
MNEKEDAKLERFVKIGLWLAILLYWISGVVLLCIGVSIQVKLRDTFVVVNDAASGVPVIITVIGTLVVIVSAFGAVALLKQSPKMIKLFTGMLLALLILEIIVGATAYTYRGKLYQTLLRHVWNTLDKYSEEVQITKGLDSLQTQFQCCGAENYTDWLNTTFGSLSSSVPRSCCKVPGENCVTDLSKHTVGINQQGCVRKLKNWVDEHIAVFGGVGIFVGLAQLSWIPFCYLLLRILKENYERIE